VRNAKKINAGQKGVFRSSRKWMIRLVEEFAFLVVSPVYLRAGWDTWPPIAVAAVVSL
jgi:hypothetical protein